MNYNNIKALYLLNKSVRIFRQRHAWLPCPTLLKVSYSVYYLTNLRKPVTFRKISDELARTCNYVPTSTLRLWIYWLRDNGYLETINNVKLRAFIATVYIPTPAFFIFLADLERCMRDTRIDR